MRTGKRYFFRNFREEFRFEVLDIIPGGDFRLKDLDTLEVYYYKELVGYGKGEDYELREIED